MTDRIQTLARTALLALLVASAACDRPTRNPPPPLPPSAPDAGAVQPDGPSPSLQWPVEAL